MRAISVSRANSVLFLGFLIFTALYLGRSFFVPFTLAIVVAMLLLPVCRKLEQWGIHRALAIIICIFIILLTLTGMLAIVASQFTGLQEDLPQIQDTVQKHLDQFQQWIQEQLNIPPQKQESFFKEKILAGTGKSGAIAKTILSGTIGGVTSLILILAYFFFFLYYREKYQIFFLKIRGDNDAPEVKEIMAKIQKLAISYIGGRFLAIVILAVLNSIGLLIVGAKNAILLGTIAALFTFVPYVGTLVGGVFAAGTVLVTQTANAALAIIGILFFIQMLDEYLIEPYIVGGNVDLSPLAVIVALVAGGLLWGIAGMILFIPFLGIAKIIFDHVPSLHPYGYLIGTNEESSGASMIDKVKGLFKAK
jgi:predicted PurR-regulated permease PerM